MKVTFSLTINDINCHDETTAKEMIATSLHGGINAKVDDINILSLEMEAISDSLPVNYHSTTYYYDSYQDFNPEEQMHAMED